MKKYPTFLIYFCAIVCYNSVAQKIDSVLYLNGKGGGIRIPSSASLSMKSQMSISVWLKPENPNSKNTEERIISKRSLTSVMDFSNTANWQLYNATNQSGNNDVKGFVGGVFDGRYIYCSPWWKGETQSGQILRYDTHNSYDNTESWKVYNAENEDGAIDIRGLEGAVYDGRYVYFVPLHHDGNYFGTVLRYDTQKEFLDEQSWEIFNAENLDPEGTLKGFVGAVFDGQYIYFVPNPFVPHAKVLRFDTGRNFSTQESWAVYDLNKLDSDKYTGKGFFGAVYDGEYIYFVPFNSTGTLLRLRVNGDFQAGDSWSSLNISEVVEGVGNYFTGAVFDGRYVYYSSYQGGRIVRFDTTGDFFDSASWTYFEILNFDGEYNVHGGVGPSFDGRYIYFPPMRDNYGRSGKFVIYDTFMEFHERDSWNFINMAEMDPSLRGFEGCVFDGQYMYFFPMNFEYSHGKILRYNTLPDENLSYSLHYSRGSSSFGSIPSKLSFRIGTEAGVRSVFNSGDHILSDGQWHHITVVYDGRLLRLYLDGVLNNTQEYATVANIIVNDSDLYIGNHIGTTEHGFEGYLNDLSIWNKALSETEIQELISSSQLNDPSDLAAFWSFDEGNNINGFKDLTLNSNNGIEFSEVGFDVAINAGETETVCPTSGSYQLSGFYPEGGSWSGNGVTVDGLFTPSILMAGTVQSLQYSVVGKFGDVSKTFTATKDIIIKSLPTVIVSGKYICENAGVTLTLVENYPEYSWSTGSATQSINVEIPGTYFISVNDIDGCELVSKSLTIDFAPVPKISQPDVLTLTASLEGSKYEWLRDDEITPESTQTVLPFRAGEYRVRITDAEGCLSKYSDVYYYTGIENNVTLFPNLGNGLFKVAVSSLETKISITVFNSVGKRVYQHKETIEGDGAVIDIDLSDQNSGFYLVSIKTQDNAFSRKIVLSR